MSGRLLLIQSLRFPSPDPRLLTLSQIKNVVPTAPIEEKDSEAICIEFDEKLNEQSIVISYAPRSIIQVCFFLTFYDAYCKRRKYSPFILLYEMILFDIRLFFVEERKFANLYHICSFHSFLSYL
uniref:Uncharacterized protein n=1 Tax=Ascaris lumbricoides TaxID=6252 RepID=A0A0M3IX52_ASCLU